MLAKLGKNKVILGALVGVLGGLAVVVLMVFGGGQSASAQDAGHSPKAAAAAKPGAKPVAADAHGSEAKFGPTYHIKDRIVNLADPGGRRFLRFSVAVEFAEHADKKADAPAGPSYSHLVVYVPGEDAADYQEVTGGKAGDPDKAFQAQIKRYVPAIEDSVMAVLSSKTFEDIRGLDGKEAAKREVKERVQRVVGGAEQVTNVYFTDFVVQ
jgi:flagellar basal body-associated protein FliL